MWLTSPLKSLLPSCKFLTIKLIGRTTPTPNLHNPLTSRVWKMHLPFLRPAVPCPSCTPLRPRQRLCQRLHQSIQPHKSAPLACPHENWVSLNMIDSADSTCPEQGGHFKHLLSFACSFPANMTCRKNASCFRHKASLGTKAEKFIHTTQTSL